MNDKDIDFDSDPDDDLPDVQPVPRRSSTDDDEDKERKRDRDQKRAHDNRSLNGRRTRGVSRRLDRLDRRRAPRNRDDGSRPPR